MKLHLMVALLAVSTMPAFATPYTLTNGAAGLTSGDIIGTVVYNGVPHLAEGAYIGPLDMTVTDDATNTSIQQIVYCTDIFDVYRPGGVYDLSTTSLAARIGSIKVGQINSLLDNVVVTDKDSGAAVQADIWEIINEPGTTGYDLTHGLFQITDVSDSAFFADASAYFAKIANGTWTPSDEYLVNEYVLALSQPPNQTFAFLPSGIHVPEPASMMLFGLGIGALGLVRRRKA